MRNATKTTGLKKKKDWIEQLLAPTKFKPAALPCWDQEKCIFPIQRNDMTFAGSIQMIFFLMLTCTIEWQGGPNEMAAANFVWLHFLNNRSSIPPFFFQTGSGPRQSFASSGAVERVRKKETPWERGCEPIKDS